MAKLGSYYSLCPLIDQRNLLGVTEDSEAGHTIVTLGRNIAIKYRLSDQKQIHSWRTKDKFSSPVIYDNETEQYVAVFNQVYIRTWKGDVEYVDKLKKFKFDKPIHTLTKCANKSFVIFKNGSVTPLKFAIENRKALELEDVIDSTDFNIEILTVTQKNDIYIGILCKLKEKTDFTWNVFNEETKKVHKIELARTNFELVGQVMSQIENQRSIHLLTLWSDGKLFSYPLDAEEDSDTQPQVKPPGNIFALVESLSCKNPVTMVPLNHHYIAMYGADSNEEGATLMLYNLQFKVSQSKQPLKLFTSDAKLWHTENNLLLCVGQNLAVIPFHLDTEQLAALVGSHRAALIDLDPDITIIEELEVVNWGETHEENISSGKSIPNRIKSKVLEFSKQGLSEATICEELIPEFIANNDLQSISNCLEYFCDIPEICLAKLLRFCLTADSKLFKNTQRINSESLLLNLQPLERCMLLDKIVICSFSDILLLPQIRAQLDLNCTLLLLQYICYMMSEDGHSLPLLNITDSENKLIDWGCLLLDANYQQFLLSRDTKILETLVYYNKLVNEYLGSLENLRQVVPLLNELRKGKELTKHKQMANLKYSIEQLSLY